MNKHEIWQEMCDRILCFYFIMTPEPMVIGNGILVNQIWQVVSAANDEKFNTKIIQKSNMCNLFLV